MKTSQYAAWLQGARVAPSSLDLTSIVKEAAVAERLTLLVHELPTLGHYRKETGK